MAYDAVAESQALNDQLAAMLGQEQAKLNTTFSALGIGGDKITGGTTSDGTAVAPNVANLYNQFLNIFSQPDSSSTPAGTDSKQGTGNSASEIISKSLDTIFPDFGGMLRDKTGSALGFSVGRTVSIVLGLLLIAGGIYFFKPVQDTVSSAGSAVVKHAKLAASVLM
jgi:hypothetical protein